MGLGGKALGTPIFAGMSLILLAFFGAPADAQPVKPSPSANPTIETYKMMLGAVAIMTNRYPKLQDVRLAIAADCHKKIDAEMSKADAAGYCYCAGVVTNAIWFSYTPSDARAAISGLMDHDAGNPEDLLKFQNSDLYDSICRAVVKDMAMQAANHQAK